MLSLSPESLRGRGRGRLRCLLLCASLLLAPGCAALQAHDWPDWMGWPEWNWGWPQLGWLGSAAEVGRVHGTLYVVNQERAERSLGPAVMYLEPVAGGAAVRAGAAADAEPARVRHDGERFAPALAALGPAQGLALGNQGDLHHRVFWLREGTRLQVDLAPGQAAETIELTGSGIVRFYCDLHSDEHFSVLVAPTPHFALLVEPGHYAMADVPTGAWRLAIWSEAMAGRIRELRVTPHEDSVQDVWIDARRLGKR